MWEENVRLSRWVKDQRALFCARRLSFEQIHALEQLKFDWKITYATSTSSIRFRSFVHSLPYRIRANGGNDCGADGRRQDLDLDQEFQGAAQLQVEVRPHVRLPMEACPRRTSTCPALELKLFLHDSSQPILLLLRQVIAKWLKSPDGRAARKRFILELQGTVAVCPLTPVQLR
jgi:hypothetical protein